MKLIPIKIDKARVKSVSLSFEDKELKWNATVCLINDRNTQITSIYVGNNSWNESDHAELSLLGIDLANQVRREVEDAVTLHMNKLNKTIGLDKNKQRGGTEDGDEGKDGV